MRAGCNIRPGAPARKLLPLLCAVFIAGGCSSTRHSVFQHEQFSTTDTYSHSFAGTDQATCEAARRALLSQGYIISERKPAYIKGSKNFQPSADMHVVIQFHVVCAPDSKGSNSTTAFVNALQDSYSLKKNINSASVGVGVLGSLSVPFGSTDDSLVKIASETIPAGTFYNRFFTLVERYLDNLPVPLQDGKDTPADESAEHDSPAQNTTAGAAAETSPTSALYKPVEAH